MTATITDVAHAAGVSIKTVSRVLNREPNVSSATREKVETAVKTLNYRPSRAARGLASSRSFLLALIYDNPNPNYVIDLQKGASDACHDAGYHLVAEPLPLSEMDDMDRVEARLRTLRVDGVILVPPLCDHMGLRALLRTLDIPVVLLGALNPSPDRLVIAMDDYKAAQEMTTHLVSLGNERLGFIRGPEDHGSSLRRYEGFQAGIKAAGLSLDDQLIRQGDYTFASGVDIAKTWLASQNPPQAIFASNDDMAAGVMSVATQKGLRVPGELSVAGFDDLPIAQFFAPGLTTVRQPIYEMAKSAAEHLIDAYRQTPHDRKQSAQMRAGDTDLLQMFEHEIILRGSTV